MIHHGDCREVMATLEADSIDSIVTDPPYGLSFMGKGWDHGVPGVEFWVEALRIAKPGAHLLAFGGSRTYHRLACAIEDAGWEVRDCIMWVYGSGFPKSHDVSKAIDREAGAEREVVGKRQYADGTYARDGAVMGQHGRLNSAAGSPVVTAPATEAAKQWAGWGTALKPAYESIIMARKPLVGTVAQNVLQYGTGGINVDGCRVGFTSDADEAESKGKNQHTKYRNPNSNINSYNGSMPSRNDYNPPGRWPANFIHDGSDEVMGLFPETGQTKSLKCKAGINKGKGTSFNSFINHNDQYSGYSDSGSAARFFYTAKASKADRDEGLGGIEIINIFAVWEKEDQLARLLVDTATSPPKVTVESTAQYKNAYEWSMFLFGKEFMDQFQSVTKSTTSTKINLTTESKTLNVLAHCITNENIQGVSFVKMDGGNHAENADNSIMLTLTINKSTASALGVNHAALPMQLRISASEGRNIHSTVKPTDLMRYLCRLVTPPGGTVLDPFCGSGSTGKGAILEGFNFIGIEREAEYVEIAKARTEWARKHYQPKLF